jgi:hypothetical protein
MVDSNNQDYQFGDVRFEVFTTVTVKISVLCFVTQYILVDMYHRFGQNCRYNQNPLPSYAAT